MDKYECPKCKKILDEVLHVYEVVLRFDVKEGRYVNAVGTGRMTIKCPDCQEVIEEW